MFFLFVNYCLHSQNGSRRPWLKPEDTDDNNLKARHAFQSLFKVRSRIPESYEYLDFSKAIKVIAKNEFGYSYGHEEVSHLLFKTLILLFLFKSFLWELCQKNFYEVWINFISRDEVLLYSTLSHELKNYSNYWVICEIYSVRHWISRSSYLRAIKEKIINKWEQNILCIVLN